MMDVVLQVSVPSDIRLRYCSTATCSFAGIPRPGVMERDCERRLGVPCGVQLLEDEQLRDLFTSP